MSKNCFVYFARPIGLEGPVKIGCSMVPADRLATLMAWAPIKLELAAVIEGDAKLERRLHGLFAEYHSHHEWFFANRALTELIASLIAGRPIGDLIDLDAPIGVFRVRPEEPMVGRAAALHQL